MRGGGKKAGNSKDKKDCPCQGWGEENESPDRAICAGVRVSKKRSRRRAWPPGEEHKKRPPRVEEGKVGACQRRAGLGALIDQRSVFKSVKEKCRPEKSTDVG